MGARAAGAEVIVAGRDAAKAEALAGRAARTRITRRAASRWTRTRVAAIRAAVDAAVDAVGHLDILVNCVGIQREEPLLDVTEEAYDEVYEVNLKAAMFLGAGRRAPPGRRASAAGATFICCRCARSSACAIAATPRTAAPRAASSCW